MCSPILLERFFFLSKNQITVIIAASTTTPPTTPPAIGPVSDFFKAGERVGDEVLVEEVGVDDMVAVVDRSIRSRSLGRS